MTEEKTQNEKTEKKKKIEAKPLPVDKKKAEEMERQNQEVKAENSPAVEEKITIIEEKKETKDEKEKEKSVSTDAKKEGKTSLEEKTSAKEDKKEKPKEKKETKPTEKKYEAVAYGRSLPISKKHAMYISNFIKDKSIDKAISDLTNVISFKRAVSFKGEIPHRKGKGMMSGRYPINASEYFINLLKGLKGNVLVNGMELEKTRIEFASASWASRPRRPGGLRAKRTNVILKAKEFSGGKK